MYNRIAVITYEHVELYHSTKEAKEFFDWGNEKYPLAFGEIYIPVTMYWEWLKERKQPMEKSVDEVVRTAYPNVHHDFITNALEGIALHDVKNQDYAGGGDPLGNFDRVAQILALYPNLKAGNRIVVCITYMLKQLDCILWGLSTGIKKKVDSVDARWIDVVVYSQLGRILNGEEGGEK